MNLAASLTRACFGACVIAGAMVSTVAQENETGRAVNAVREWRQAREPQLIDEYMAFLKIPNVSRDRANVRRNADYVLDMMRKRGITSLLLEVPDASPIVYGEILSPGAAHTYVFYAHYDGQPVDPKDWVTPPFEPVLRSARLDKGGQVVTLPAAGQRVNPEWRIYARSASDDKANIFAMLSAVDALHTSGLKPSANIKFVFEGEEEMESVNLGKILQANKDLLQADLWLICDGPEHASGRQTVTFGARGIQQLEVTIYGPTRELHSGHYGNWAPNPAMMLAQLLASMKGADGRVMIEHFYDGVVPLSPLEQRAIADAPNEDAALMRDMGLARTDGSGRRLAELINQPSLNIRGLSSAHVGAAAANVIPSTATVSLDLRLVKGVTHQQQAERVTAHIRQQGYFVTSADPDEQTRLAHPRIAKVVAASGYDAVRTPMDLPAAQAVIAAAKSVRTPVVLEPTSGGSVPLATIQDILGTNTILIPIANADNSQHSANENIRLRNLWNGIDTQAALLMMK